MAADRLTDQAVPAAAAAAGFHDAFWKLIHNCNRALRAAEIRFDPFDCVFLVSATAQGGAPILVRSPDVVGAITAVAATVIDHDRLTAVAPPITDERLVLMRGELVRLRCAYAKVEGVGDRADNPIIKLIELSESLLAEIARSRKA